MAATWRETMDKGKGKINVKIFIMDFFINIVVCNYIYSFFSAFHNWKSMVYTDYVNAMINCNFGIN